MDTTTVITGPQLATNYDIIVSVLTVTAGPIIWFVMNKLEARFALDSIKQSIAIVIALGAVFLMGHFTNIQLTLLGSLNAAMAILGMASQTKKTILSVGDIKKSSPTP